MVDPRQPLVSLVLGRDCVFQGTCWNPFSVSVPREELNVHIGMNCLRPVMQSSEQNSRSRSFIHAWETRAVSQYSGLKGVLMVHMQCRCPHRL